MIFIENEKKTIEFAKKFAKTLKAGDIISLKGDLGVGKTTIARAIIQCRTLKETIVPSPTFNLVQIYEEINPSIFHFDLYRLNNPEEILELNIEEAFYNGISLIEWPENAIEYIPKRSLVLQIEENKKNENQRTIDFIKNKKWNKRLEKINFEDL